MSEYDLVLRWNGAPVDCHCHVSCAFDGRCHVFHFVVDESTACFRLEHRHDGDACWQDSCVEVFLQSGADPTQYFNFECNAGGAILAECGVGRADRRRFEPDEYAKIARRAVIRQQNASRVSWELTVWIPDELIGRPAKLVGNLYKCASNAACPHYLSLFPIEAPKPDFHRPEAFREILA